MKARTLLGVAGAVVMLAACDQPLTEQLFQKRAEKLFVEINPGFGIQRRIGMTTYFVRGDQIFTLKLGPRFEAYKVKKGSTSDFFDAWRAELEKDAAARRRTLEQAKAEIIPILKSDTWINVQDLGAIGPPRIQDKIRPWRKSIAREVFALIGVPEELLGFRYASVAEMSEAEGDEEAWLNTAIANLEKKVGTSTGVELRSKDGHLLVYDMPNEDGVAGLVLSPKFRKRMLMMFAKEELGAAVPNRDVLIVFDPTDFVTVKPIRARTHQLYQARNHPGFRGLLRFDAQIVGILEPAERPKR